MMFADLVDDEDFRNRLRALGVGVSPAATPDECARAALAADAVQRVEGLRELAAALAAQADAVLPAVRDALELIRQGAAGE
jgi:hypothetical protein